MFDVCVCVTPSHHSVAVKGLHVADFYIFKSSWATDPGRSLLRPRYRASVNAKRSLGCLFVQPARKKKDNVHKYL